MPKFMFRCAKVAARTSAGASTSGGTSARRTVRFPALAAAAVALSLLLTACGGGAAGNGDGKPVVLTTFTVLADVARNVAGDKLTVESITKAGAEIHGYEPTPGDIRKASKADLILDNGLNLEAWFGQFVEGSLVFRGRNPGPHLPQHPHQIARRFGNVGDRITGV
ncbi:MAG: metal ABC transporter solute-binding protein, Zn/Mn family, partial [Actinomycetes bacterium]